MNKSDVDKVVERLPRSLIVFKALITNDEGKYLLLKRSDYMPFNANKWEFAGGKLDYGENIHDVLAREVEEETKLKITYNKYPTYVFYDMCEDYKDIPRILMFFRSKVSSGSIVLSSEHTEYKWLDIDDAIKIEDLMPESIATLTYLTTTPSRDIL
jgi:8-oxo-dGTP diphosphatase